VEDPLGKARCLGEGSDAAAAIIILRAAVEIHSCIASFADAGVPGNLG